MPRHQLTKEERQRGGQNVPLEARKRAWEKMSKQPGKVCKDCNLEFDSMLSYAGHRGLHGFANSENSGCNGDLNLARQKLGIMGAATSDPFPENGAYAEGHRLLAAYRGDELPF